MNNLISTLSLMVTYQCNAQCQHCGPYCGPEEKDWMTTQEIKDLVLQAQTQRATNVIFTGGEPTLLKDKLIDLFSFIRKNTTLEIRMVTNGWWAKSYDIALKKLVAWKNAGLDEINISCGEYHQEYIPIENVVNAYRAGVDAGFKTVLLAGEFIKYEFAKTPPELFYAKLGEYIPSMREMSPFINTYHGMEKNPVIRCGRGITIDPVKTILFEEESLGSACSDVNSVFTCHPNGNVTACCGVMVRDESLLTVGNWRNEPLIDILNRSHRDIIINAVRYMGLKELKNWLLEKDPELIIDNTHCTICDLCAKIFMNKAAEETLLKHAGELNDSITINKIAKDTFQNQNYKY